MRKKADVVPVPKTRPPTNVNDLRPISLTAKISKVLESFVAQWMLEAASNKFDEKEFGALRGRSTVHALIDILHLWHQALDKTHSVRVLFIDFTKAFDHVDYVIVLEKLAKLGVPEFICH